MRQRKPREMQEQVLTERNPPLNNAAAADEALAQAYQLLTDLKLGFDSWEDIPRDVRKKIYDPIVKAMGDVGKVRQDVYNIRMQVKRKYR